MKPMTFMMIVGILLNLVVGWAVDAAIPGAHLLGMNLRGVVFFAACQAAALWIGVRFDLVE